MRNKILSTAIAGALSMGAHGVAQAQDPGVLTLTNPTQVIQFATELFPNTTTALPSDPANGFTVKYAAKGQMDEDFYATFTLSSGTWSKNLVSADLKITNNTGVPYGVNAALVESGEDDQSTVTFLVPVNTAGTPLNTNDLLEFSFQVNDDAGILANNGAIRLGAAFPIAANPAKFSQTTPADILIATATEGAKTELLLDTATTDTFIDVALDGKVFANSSIDELTARLGFIKITSTPGVVGFDGLTPYNFNTTVTGGSLQITDGVFSASEELGTNVFIDTNRDGIFDDTLDIPATTVTATTAEWDLVVADLELIVASGNDGSAIVVKVNGTTEIEPQEDPALAVLILNYQSGAKPYQRRLEHIKRNGTRCKAYNVPYPGSKDNAFFRFTSKTDGVEGVVKGTLYKEDGTIVASDKGPDGTTFKDVDLLQLKYTDGPTLTTNQTKVISNQNIADLATETWTGRATLVVSSNLTSMEMLALIRNQAGVVGPLMNLSTGASGNACD